MVVNAGEQINLFVWLAIEYKRYLIVCFALKWVYLIGLIVEYEGSASQLLEIMSIFVLLVLGVVKILCNILVFIPF